MFPVTSSLHAFWQERGILNWTGASDAEIARFEARDGVVFPSVVREYFLNLNGTGYAWFRTMPAAAALARSVPEFPRRYCSRWSRALSRIGFLLGRLDDRVGSY